MKTENTLRSFGGGITSSWSHQGLTETTHDKKSCDTSKEIQFIQQYTKNCRQFFSVICWWWIYTPLLNVRGEAMWTLHLVKSEKVTSSSNLCRPQVLTLMGQTSMAVYMHLHWNSKQFQRE